MGSSQVSGLERVLDFADSSGDSGDEGYMPSRPMMQNVYQSHDILASPSSYTSGMVAFNPSTYGVKQDNQMPYSNLTSAPMQGPEPPFHGQASFHHHQASSTGSIPGIERSDSWSHEDVSAETLSEVLGELKIDERGMGKLKLKFI